MNSLPKKEILGVGITSATENQILEYIFSSVKNSQQQYFVVTPNPEILMYAKAHPEYSAILNKAEIALCDGVGVFLAGQLLARPIKERVTGVDLLDRVCRKAANEGAKDVKNAVTIGLLGAGKGIALKASERLIEKYPGLQVVFVSQEWSSEGFKVERPSNQGVTVSHSIDILFVAFGFPKQEEWMVTHIRQLPVKVMVGVGGAFDYISGAVPRAPKFMRALGLEWLYRLIRQPWRIKRQVVLPHFLLSVLKEKFR